MKKWNWKKGYGKYPKDWANIKKQIIVRDKETCVRCGDRVFYSIPYSWLASNPITNFRVHHKDLNKGNNNFDNLVFVCSKCHGKLHREENQKYAIFGGC